MDKKIGLIVILVLVSIIDLTKLNYIKHNGNTDPCKTLRKKYPYSELFWSAFSRIRTEYGEISLRI